MIIFDPKLSIIPLPTMEIGTAAIMFDMQIKHDTEVTEFSNPASATSGRKVGSVL